MKRLLILLAFCGYINAETVVCRTDKCRQKCSPTVRITHEPVRCTQKRTIVERPCKRRVVVEDTQPYEVCETTYTKKTITERCLAPCGQKSAVPIPDKCISLSRRKEARYMRKGMISVDGRGCGHCYGCKRKHGRCEQDACSRESKTCKPPCLNPRKACRRYEDAAPVRTVRATPQIQTEGIPAVKTNKVSAAAGAAQRTDTKGYVEDTNNDGPTNYLDELEKELVSRLR